MFSPANLSTSMVYNSRVFMTSCYKGNMCEKFSFQEDSYVLGLGLYIYKPLSKGTNYKMRWLKLYSRTLEAEDLGDSTS